MCRTRGLECFKSAMRITRKSKKAPRDRPLSPSKTVSTESSRSRETSEPSTDIDLATTSLPDLRLSSPKRKEYAEDYPFEPRIASTVEDLPEFPDFSLLSAGFTPALFAPMDRDAELYFLYVLFIPRNSTS